MNCEQVNLYEVIRVSKCWMALTVYKFVRTYPFSRVRHMSHVDEAKDSTTYQCIEDCAYKSLWTVISTMSPSSAVRRGHGVSPLQTIITLQRPPSCMGSAVAYTGVTSLRTLDTYLDSSTAG